MIIIIIILIMIIMTILSGNFFELAKSVSIFPCVFFVAFLFGRWPVVFVFVVVSWSSLTPSYFLHVFEDVLR